MIRFKDKYLEEEGDDMILTEEKIILKVKAESTLEGAKIPGPEAV